VRGSFRLSYLVIPIGIVGGFALLCVRPSQAWIERAYVNGAYAAWQHTISAVTVPLAFSLDDVIKCVFLLAAVAIVIAGWRRSVLTARVSEGPRSELPARIRRHIGVFFLTIAELLALGGYIAMWFVLGWGWNYDRGPVESRVQYNAAALTPVALARLRVQTMHEMNVLAARAHRRIDASGSSGGDSTSGSDTVNIQELQGVWLPVVQRLGDTWTPYVSASKATLVDPFMNANGTSGFISPFTLEVLTASDLLWFERPFDLAHEWTHIAGFAREDEANYVAALTCIRSRDPVIAYSGWLEIFLYLPPLKTYKRSMFAPQVWQDFEALRKRNDRHINLAFSHFSWGAYNAYLKSNRIASGINSYNEVVRLLLAIPRDSQGLPRSVPAANERNARVTFR
jgi:hypothetical protein